MNLVILIFSFLTAINGLVIPQQILNVVTSNHNSDEVIPLLDKSIFPSWVYEQSVVSWKNLLANIGDSEYCQDDALFSGVIVASPSKVKPDYYYQWTRDSALTIRTLIHYLQDYQFNDTSIQILVEDFIWNNYELQRLNTVSGDLMTGGLGEPKFHVDNTPFNKNWGRPQSDGPGLRITSIWNYLSILSQFNQQFLTDLNETFIYNEIVRPDLIYVMDYWKKDSFDLWEEIDSIHFFTNMVQLKGLYDGIQLAKKVGEDQGFIDQVQDSFDELNSFIKSFFIKDGINYIIESPKLHPHTRSGLDAAVLLGSIHAHEMINEIDDNIPFNIDNDHLINHLMSLLKDMRLRYPINHDKLGSNLGIGIGRYPEDVYDGYGTSEGNPWFISTATAAEVVYKLTYKFITDKKDITVNKINREFFNQFVNLNSNDEIILINYNSQIFRELMDKLFKFSDSFLGNVRDHVDNQGGISEQFNKYHGFMQGARDLTWSYSSVLNSIRWRNKMVDVLSNFGIME